MNVRGQTRAVNFLSALRYTRHILVATVAGIVCANTNIRPAHITYKFAKDLLSSSVSSSIVLLGLLCKFYLLAVCLHVL